MKSKHVERTWYATQGITLVALVITIIVLLILAGVTISLTIGENGLIKTAQGAGEKSEEANAKEKLEMALLDLQSHKATNTKYNQDEYINNYLSQEQIITSGDIAIVDGWQFAIDRSVPKVVAALGKGQESQETQIDSTINYENNFTTATININIISEIELSSIVFNGENLLIPDIQNSTYSVTKQVSANGTYSIYVKNKNEEYKISTIKVTELSEDTEISTIEEFITFRDRVNKGATYEGKTITLSKDLDLSSMCYKVDGTSTNDISWIPIGTTTNLFKGTFNGNNHTVTGIYINSTSANQGLFGAITDGTVENLKISGEVKSTTNYVGLLVSTVYTGTFKNITALENSQASGKDYVGGIIGRMDSNSNISDSTNFANVISTDGWYTGGICGTSKNSTITGCKNVGQVTGKRHVGGIAGIGTGTIIESYNTADITGSQGHVGGIAGRNNEGMVLEIKYCYNTGNITGKGDDGTGYTSVGGIAGSQVKINYCYNTGNIYGAKGQAAGICGNEYGQTGNRVTYCYNTGTISGGGRAIGSIVGECYNSGVDHCYWTSSQGCRGYRGSDSNCKKMTVEEMKAYTNEYMVANDNENYHSGYPILYWENNNT